MDTINQAIEFLAHLADYVGIVVIFWGVVVGFVGFISLQLPSRKERDFLQATAKLRCKIGTYLLLGLEILIASDIAQTVIDPSYERVILLGAIVAIRTILSFFLSRELETIDIRP
jgi:uncharacterized membrane protein